MKQKKIISFIIALAVAATATLTSSTNGYAAPGDEVPELENDSSEWENDSSDLDDENPELSMSTSNHETNVINGDPVGVEIDGIQIIGSTLKAQLLKENGENFYSSLSAEYRWYRSSSQNAEGTLVGSDETYLLSDNDIGKYIKLEVVYNASVFETTIGKIGRKSSSSTSEGITYGYWLDNDNGTKMYYESGKFVTGWKNIDGEYYVFNSNGIMQTGWWKYNGKDYYLNGDGAMVSGWVNIDGKSYYFNNDGSLA